MSRRRNKKYSKELKIKAVEEFLAGNGSQLGICRKYEISSHTQLQEWIKVYNGHKELKESHGSG
ncbi:MAG: transposase, partial [Clostridia bacterium]